MLVFIRKPILKLQRKRRTLRFRVSAMITISKTIYDKKGPEDGTRILVMAFWPRGIKKDAVDEWIRDLGSERGLIRDWKGGHITWEEFRKRYTKSLQTREKRLIIDELAKRTKSEMITLLCSCKDRNRCHRAILKEVIERAS